MNGILLVDKPAGMTSFGVVARVRRITKEKCGHSGTLDPLATGLLPVMVGKATKLCDLLTAGEKQYIGVLRFGLRTDTGDITGEILEEKPAAVTEEQLRSILPRFTGTITQRPPVYSAIKVDGVPLYRHARAGRAVEAPERQVKIEGLTLLNFDGEAQEATLQVDCSKGTYIRTLFEDLAVGLGTLGTMAALRRTRVGNFHIEDALPLDTWLEQGCAPICPMDQALSFLPRYEPDPFFATLLKNGCAVEQKKLKGLPEGLCRVYAGEQLIGLGKIEENCFKVVTHL